MNPWLVVALGACMCLKSFTRNDADSRRDSGKWETLICVASLLAPLVVSGIAAEEGSRIAALGILFIWGAWWYEAFERKRGFVPPADKR